VIRKFHWSARATREVIAAIEQFAQLVRPKETIRLITEDESDNRVLECALEASADFVITGDQHLRQLRTFRGIAIASPGEFMEAYEARGLGG